MMNARFEAAKRLTDTDLLQRTKELAASERGATVELIAHLAEVDARRLQLGEGYGSLFSYCTAGLLLSEHEACNRIEAARASRRFPEILPRLERGELNLTTVRLLAPHLTADNHIPVLDAARGLSKRAVLELVAGLAPRPDVASSVRMLPTTPVPEATPMARSAASGKTGLKSDSPIARPESAHDLPALGASGQPEAVPPVPERYRIQFTAGRETHVKFRRLQGHLRREIRNGDPAEIFDRALTLLLERVERGRNRRLTRVRAEHALR